MKVVVAYSGGLDTSVIVRWVKETYNAEVICYCADVGQQEELDGLEAKAIATGASKCIIDDLNEEFAKDFIFRCSRAKLFTKTTISWAPRSPVRSLPNAWSK
jgi:argininosuccinate synthase